MKVCNKYQSLFFGILKDSPAPAHDLEYFGLSKELSVLAGTNFFMKEYPIDAKNTEFLKEINNKVSPFKVAAFYASHPSRYIKKLQVTAQNGFKLLQGFGNYEEKESSNSRKTATAFRSWSDFKGNIIPHSFIMIFSFFMVYLIMLFAYYFKASGVYRKIFLEALILLGVLGTVQFVVPVIGDGEADLSKHLFLFNVCFDLMLIISSVYMVNLSLKLISLIFSSVQRELPTNK
jgi:hypothetical protein